MCVFSFSKSIFSLPCLWESGLCFPVLQHNLFTFTFMSPPQESNCKEWGIQMHMCFMNSKLFFSDTPYHGQRLYASQKDTNIRCSRKYTLKFHHIQDLSKLKVSLYIQQLMVGYILICTLGSFRLDRKVGILMLKSLQNTNPYGDQEGIALKWTFQSQDNQYWGKISLYSILKA